MEFLTKEEIEDFRKAFSMFDNDGSGTISSRELVTAMQNLNLRPTEDEIEALIKVRASVQIEGGSWANLTNPTGVAGVNLVTGCPKVFFFLFTIPTPALA